MLSTPTVTQSITINSPVSKVWLALTIPEQMKQWMSDTEMEILSEGKAGGRMVIRGRANGNHEYKGKILQYEPEKMLRYTSWTSISKSPDVEENYSVIEFALTTTGNQTTVALTHSNLVTEATYAHSRFYWGVALVALKEMVEGLLE